MLNHILYFIPLFHQSFSFCTQRAEEEQATSASEALALKEQQDTTIKRVLESQLELDQE